jgi:hypothetical protein
MLEHVLNAVDGIHDVLAERLDAFLGPHGSADGESTLLGVVEHGIDILIELLFAMLVSSVDVERRGVDEFYGFRAGLSDGLPASSLFNSC